MQRAEDLVATFETSKRTIYRDIEALAESGVPVVSVPGQGYSLVEGYFLPPVSFTADEAMMLLLGADAAKWQFLKVIVVLSKAPAIIVRAHWQRVNDRCRHCAWAR